MVPAEIVGLTFAYGLTSLAYGYLLHRRPGTGPGLLYAFVMADPVMLVIVLAHDPEYFAFLNPFLLIVIVPSGIRYGIRTMYLSWVVTILAAPLLLTSEFWRANVEMTFSFVLMLAFVPLFFSTLVRRIHNVRAIEVERARLGAMNEVVVARSSVPRQGQPRVALALARHGFCAGRLRVRHAMATSKTKN